MKRLLFCLVLLAVIGCGESGRTIIDTGCAIDLDCAGAQICQSRRCVDPDGVPDGAGPPPIDRDASPVDVAPPDAAPVGCVRVVPERLVFPATLVGRSERLSVRIEGCGDAPLLVERVYLTDESAAAFSIDEPVEVEPGYDVVVRFAPAEPERAGGMLVIETNDPTAPAVEIPIMGRGSLHECPTAAVVTDHFRISPHDIVTLDGATSTAPFDPEGRPTRYQWTVINRPAGSTSIPLEVFPPRIDEDNQDDPGTPTAAFVPGVVGEYDVALTVTDASGVVAPSERCPQVEAIVHITAVMDAPLYVEATWHTPNDPDPADGDGVDVDLHLLHPSGNGVGWRGILDCYYANIQPDWGPAGAVGNPSLDIDDVTGAGPEAIVFETPEDTDHFDGGYRVGAHYFRSYSGRDSGDWGESLITVRVFFDGVLVGEWARRLLRTDHFWEAVEILWTPDNPRVEPIDRYYECVPDPFLCP